MKWIKRLILSLSLILALLVVAVASLPWLIDPNDFKPQIQNLAAEQGYDLTLQGPISWTFYPNLGFRLENTQVQRANDTAEFSTRDMLAITDATLSVAVKPLFSRQIQVNSLLIDGANIHVEVNANEELNWRPDVSQSTAPEDSGTTVESTSTDRDPSRPLTFAVQSLALKNINLKYLDQGMQQEFQAKNLSLTLQNVALNNQPFPLQLSTQLQHSALPTTVTLELNTDITVSDFSQSQQKISVDSAELQATFTNLDNITSEILSTFQIHAENSSEEWQLDGQFELAAFNPSSLFQALAIELPEMRKPTALTSFSLASQLSGISNTKGLQLSFNSIDLQLDDSHLIGKIDLSLFEQQLPAVNLAAQIDTLNLDDYLPPATEQGPSTASTNNQTPNDTPLPLESLRAFNAEIDLAIDHLVIQQSQLGQSKLKMSGINGQWRVQPFATNAFSGSLVATAQLDASQSTMELSFDSSLDNINIQQALIEQANIEDISGNISGHLKGSVSAARYDQLLSGTDANLSFTSDELMLNGFNAEKYYCDLAEQIQNSNDSNSSWPNYTRIHAVNGDARLQNNNIEIENLTANAGPLSARIVGQFDISSQQFSMRLPLTFKGQETSTTGSPTTKNHCVIRSNFLANRELDILQCRGSLEQIEFGKQCGLDRGAFNDALKLAVRYNVDKELEERGVPQKVEEKKQEARDKLKEKLNELLGGDEEETESSRQLIKNIFNLKSN